MRPEAPTERGFTLFEIIVVLAVISILIGILTPRVLVYIDDANLSRAQADANSIAAAIEKMYEDTGRWPFYADGQSKLAWQSGDYTLLTTATACTGTTSAAACDSNAPDDATTLDTWGLAAGAADALVHHLVMNAPGGVVANGYATTGHRAWKGPYLHRVPDVDPWGKSFYVNIANADPADEGLTQLWVVVISAGPDGELDSAANLEAVDNPQPIDDDIIANVK